MAQLARASEALGSGELARLYRERAEELLLEAQLAERVGTPGFRGLARRRYPVGSSPDWHQAEAFAQRWAAGGPPPRTEPEWLSDDPRAGDSLISQLRRCLGQLRLPVRVQVVADLASTAATADGVVWVRAGVRLGAACAARITRHEVFGHVLPRWHGARQSCGLFAAGSRGATDDEEGRALWLERHAAAWDDERRFELAVRHLAALWVADGADAVECVRHLTRLGCTPPRALALYLRVARGGGLCRELVYLPAWARVGAALSGDAGLERWLAQGRLTIAAARSLRELGIRPRTDA